jgi:hypothetical protein
MGHDCVIWGKGHENFGEVPDFNLYDLVINLENYGDEWLPDMSRWSRPFKMIWCIDAHVRGQEPYERIFRNGKYDILAHSTKAYVREKHHLWLPNCTDASLVKPMPTVAKTHRIGFCGNHVTPQRKQAVNLLSQVFGLKQDIFVIGEDMVRAINSYHIHFNMNIANDINYRSFETLACGTVLVTNYSPEYLELGFVDGVNCFFYTDERDMVRVVTKAINMIGSPEFASIGDAGRQLFLERHTYAERAEKILLCIERIGAS